ncbi:Inosose isomerase [Anaerohalosphaera lusitana]|uniref:Inosose isomerase n=1 Tax=Anaerohalosphaera lusitana TaxID=1936003 RepID=A0A1U9NHY1_9BACT|nr:sugar phosphate isomerase/epimerase family protein [Anaerohalosphaera lusitana]AQT67425.1 Inosose isomerase [Anaerohalosphaera lusitana]
MAKIQPLRTFFFVQFLCIALLLCSCSARQSAKLKNEPFSPKIGVCTSKADSQFMERAGLDYIESSVRGFLVPTKEEDVFQAANRKYEEEGVKTYACNGFLPGSLKSVGPDAKHDEIITYCETAFRRAEEAGVKYIVFGSGASRRIPDGFDPTRAREQFVELLGRMGPVAGKDGVTVVIEPLRSKECNFINRVDEALAIAKDVHHPNIRVLADFYHMMQEGEGPESIIAAGEYLRHCHIAENEGRWYPGKNGEDFTPYLQALKDIGYNGGISMECRWSDFPNEVGQAVDFLEMQIEAVKVSPEY